ncbi:MAG: ABC transporter ATP-binding protein [Deltaproteobacteria bacterium]|nr:ABC transporter ATP-binding protein [Deltaproteobacteria bacterium]
MISVRGLRRSFEAPRGRVEALRGIDCDIADGEFVAILGASGSGKTTFLQCLGGLDRGYAGALSVNGTELSAMSDAALSGFRNEAIGFVFQSFHLLPHLTCAENVFVPSFFAGANGRRRLSRAEASRRAVEQLREVGLERMAGDRPGILSGGERQRVAIARALFNEPKIVLGDEPTGNLDAKTGAEIVAILERLHAERGVTIVVVTHEDRMAKAARRVLRMEEGRLAS